MPYLTDEQRKKPLEYYAHGFTFACKHCDLSAPVEVSCRSPWYSKKHLAAAIAEFTCHFMIWIHPHLNGFSGIDTVQWDIRGKVNNDQ